MKIVYKLPFTAIYIRPKTEQANCHRLSYMGRALCDDSLNVLCCAEAAESQVDIAQISRKTPTKGSCSSICVVITKKLLYGSPRFFTVLLKYSFQLVLQCFSVTRGFGSPDLPLKTNMALARLECEGKDGVNSSDWLYVYPITTRGSFVCVRWYSSLEMNGESRGTRLELVWQWQVSLVHLSPVLSKSQRCCFGNCHMSEIILNLPIKSFSHEHVLIRTV